jgi:hypothetical protein
LVLITLFSTTDTTAAPIQITLETVGNTETLKSGQGFLLINLEISGAAPSIEFYRINGGEQTFLRPTQKFKKKSKKFIIDLKNKPNGYYFSQLPNGLYQITKINVPYFEFPFRLNTAEARDWRFSIVENKVNYVGKLEIDKERSSKNVNVQLHNRIATDMDEINKLLATMTTIIPLRSGTGVRDDFFDSLGASKGN